MQVNEPGRWGAARGDGQGASDTPKLTLILSMAGGRASGAGRLAAGGVGVPAVWGRNRDRERGEGGSWTTASNPLRKWKMIVSPE